VARRSRGLYGAAMLLSNCQEMNEFEVSDNLRLLFRELCRQHTELFASLLADKTVLQQLLKVGPEKSSALLHSNNMSYDGFEHFKRSLENIIGFQIFPCKSRILANDKKALVYVTEENFDVMKLNLFHTTNSTAPSPRAAIRAKDLPRLLGQLLSQTRAEQRGSTTTSNPRHQVYRRRALVLLESDKGGQCMKHGWRVGPTGLKILGAYQAGDTRPNMVSFEGPWAPQLQDIRRNGVMVRVEPGDSLEVEMDDRDELDAEMELLVDLRPVQEAGPCITGVELEPSLRVQWVPDHEAYSILDFDPTIARSDEEQMAVTELEQGRQKVAELDKEQDKEEAETVAGQKAELHNVPVDIVNVCDMAYAYIKLGLNGASSLWPSPFTLVTREHLGNHAIDGKPHNWENCRSPYRYPGHIYKSWVACSQDPRNNGDPVKNAKHHFGSKASPVMTFAEGIRDLLSTFAPFLLHIDLGVIGVWFLNHAQLVARIIDQQASEAELLELSDMLAQEMEEEEQEDTGSASGGNAATPILLERKKLEAELKIASTELLDVKAELEGEREVMASQENFRECLVAVSKGDEGREQLLSIGRQLGHPYCLVGFNKSTKNLACFPHCLLTGHAREVTTVVCSSCGKATHEFCLAKPEMEVVTCRMCAARAAAMTGTTNQELAENVISQMVKETDVKIADSRLKQVKLEGMEQRFASDTAALEEQQKAAMGPREKKFNQVLTTDVKAFRQTFASKQLTGHGITKVLQRRDLLVAVFADTKWGELYKQFLDNYSVYHHLSMSQQPLGPRRMGVLELSVRNLSIVLAKFQCRLTPKMDVLLTIVVPFARRWGCLGIFREERIESMHGKVNKTECVLVCIQQKEVRLFRVFQREELKDLCRELGQPVKKGPRSPEEKAKREANARARHLADEQTNLPLVEVEMEPENVAAEQEEGEKEDY
jgi:hypothetical protein